MIGIQEIINDALTKSGFTQEKMAEILGVQHERTKEAEPTTCGDLMKWGETISWCEPKVTENGRIIWAQNGGDLCGAIVDGEDMGGMTEEEAAEAVHGLAKIAAGEEYEEYSGWKDIEILREHSNDLPGGCRACPWFSICEAMTEIVEN